MTKPTQKDLEEWGAWLAECTSNGMTLEEMHAWQKNKIATGRKLRGFLPSRGPLFELVTCTHIGPMNERPTGDCLFGRQWKDQPRKYGRWLPAKQHATKTCPVTVLSTRWPSSYQEWAAAVLGVPEYTSESELEKLLIERKIVVTLPQMEVLVKRSDRHIGSALLLDEPGNFFFAENNAGGVSVLSIRCKQQWESYLKGFCSQHVRVTGCRLIVANIDFNQLELPLR